MYYTLNSADTDIFGARSVSGYTTMKTNLETDFVANTTMHGISRVFQSGSKLAKITWGMTFVAAMGLFAWQFTERIRAYYKYDFSTLVQVRID